MTDRYEGKLPDGWSGGNAVSKWWRGRLSHLYRLTKPCAECGGEMRIDVTKHALDGIAKNAGLHLKRCNTCRAKSKSIKTTSRPHVNGEPPPGTFAKQTVNEQMQTAIATLTAEVTGLYAQNKELRQQLARYEAASAQKMPWEG